MQSTLLRMECLYKILHYTILLLGAWSILQLLVLILLLMFMMLVNFQSLLLSSTSSLELCAYFDADYDSDLTNCKSVTRFCIFLGDFLIS